MILTRLCLISVVFALIASFALAEDPAGEQDRIKALEKKIEDLQKQVDSIQHQAAASDLEEIRNQLRIVAEEVEKLRSG